MFQIRLTNGQALTQTFGCKEQLSAVRLYIEMNRTDGSGGFNLMTTFPRKVFTEEDYEKPLNILGQYEIYLLHNHISINRYGYFFKYRSFVGLVPTAVIIVQKKAELQ